jgi:NADPH:quinone reductase
MRVVRATAFGDPEVLQPGEAAEPEPGPGELLVDVAVAEVLFLDTQLRAGWGGEYFAIRPPFVPGVGVAGTVVALGDGVAAHWEGAQVIASSSAAGEYNGGGYAERAVVAAEAAHAVPDGVGLQDAIAALHDGRTALSRIERAQLAAGDRVLVTAAGGGLGVWLVPLAAAAGATVAAAARGERKLALARDRGAHVAIDYSSDDWSNRVRAELGGVDVVFDGAGGQIGGEALRLTVAGARFLSYGAASGDFPDVGAEAERRGVRVIGLHDQMPPVEQRRLTAAALDLIAAGEIRPLIGQVVPLERAAEAHAAIAARRVPGKTLLVTA